MDLPDLSVADWRNCFAAARRLAVAIGNRGLCHQLRLDVAYLREPDATVQGAGK